MNNIFHSQTTEPNNKHHNMISSILQRILDVMIVVRTCVSLSPPSVCHPPHTLKYIRPHLMDYYNHCIIADKQQALEIPQCASRKANTFIPRKLTVFNANSIRDSKNRSMMCRKGDLDPRQLFTTRQKSPRNPGELKTRILIPRTMKAYHIITFHKDSSRPKIFV